jgi:hypothetical protein
MRRALYSLSLFLGKPTVLITELVFKVANQSSVKSIPEVSPEKTPVAVRRLEFPTIVED